MTRKRLFLVGLSQALVVIAGAALAQSYGQQRQPQASGIIEDRRGVPDWKVDEHFPKDVFTFVRVEYDSFGSRRGGWGGFGEVSSRPLPTLVSMEQQPRRGRGGGRRGGFGGGGGGFG